MKDRKEWIKLWWEQVKIDMRENLRKKATEDLNKKSFTQQLYRGVKT